jgi:hypothetical protein
MQDRLGQMVHGALEGLADPEDEIVFDVHVGQSIHVDADDDICIYPAVHVSLTVNCPEHARNLTGHTELPIFAAHHPPSFTESVQSMWYALAFQRRMMSEEELAADGERIIAEIE